MQTMMELMRKGSRLYAAFVHAGVSLVVACLAATLVFVFWYPGDYRIVAGGLSLFQLVVTVDVILGPLLMFVVFNPRKKRKELVTDICVIVVFQLAALCYGLYTVALVRPLALVHEVDRFRIVTSVDVHPGETGLIPVPPVIGIQAPLLLGTRRIELKENFDASILAQQGFDIGQRPSFWRPYPEHRTEVLRRALPLQKVLDRVSVPVRERILTVIQTHRIDAGQAKVVPLISREADWGVLLDGSGDVLGFIPMSPIPHE